MQPTSRRHHVRLVLAVFVVASLRAACYGQGLTEDLGRIEELRHYHPAVPDEVRALVKELRERYPAPADQGKLLCQAVVTLVCSDSTRDPDLIIAYAREALDLPIEPADRLTMFGHWGGTVEAKHPRARGDEFRATRREAATLWLRGLRKGLDRGVPENDPPAPDGPPLRDSMDLRTDPAARASAEEARRRDRAEREAYARARAAYEATQEMVIWRRSFEKGVVELYSRDPSDVDELNRLAEAIVHDVAVVGRLVAEVREATERRAPAPERQVERSERLGPDTLVRLVANPDTLPADPGTWPTPESGLQDGLRELESLRGRERVEAKADELLWFNRDAAARGKIHYAAMRAYGSGPPELLIDHARAALECPLSPPQRMQALVSWGDAVIHMHDGASGEALRPVRREACTLYLRAMREAMGGRLPELPPPATNPEDDYTLWGDWAEYDPKQGKVVIGGGRDPRRALELQERRNNRRDMIIIRDGARRQVVHLYSRPPYDTAELRRLATDVLRDGPAVDFLVGTVEYEIRAREDAAERSK